MRGFDSGATCKACGAPLEPTDVFAGFHNLCADRDTLGRVADAIAKALDALSSDDTAPMMPDYVEVAMAELQELCPATYASVIVAAKSKARRHSPRFFTAVDPIFSIHSGDQLPPVRWQ